MEIDIGRRRDELGDGRAQAAVLDVTKVMLQEVGYQGLRPEVVAARAGVPRVWLRRWWTTRSLLVAECLQRTCSPPEILPTGDVRADVQAVVARGATLLADPVVTDALAGLASDAGSDPVAAERLATLLGAWRAADTSVLLSAVARGDLRPDTDIPMVLDTVFGALLFRRVRGAATTEAVLERLVDDLVSSRATGRPPVAGQGVDSEDADGDTAVASADGDGQHSNGQHAGRQDSDAQRLRRYRHDEYRPDGPGSDVFRSDGQGSDVFRPGGNGSDDRASTGAGQERPT